LFKDLAVIVVVPGAIALTSPVLLTVAMLGFCDSHVMVFNEALDGKIVAVSCLVPLMLSVADVGETLTESTGTHVGPRIIADLSGSASHWRSTVTS
jgi:hypothetical protein